MRFIKLFEEYTKQEIKEQTDIIYRDKNLVVLVVKTPTSSDIYGKNTRWCSVGDIRMFHEHNVAGNMFRILFKDGYKLRLTWDYKDDYNTHWGQGGKVDGKILNYTNLRCRDVKNPFYMDYDKNDGRQLLADRIKSLPIGAIRSIKEYHEKNISLKDEMSSELKLKIDSMLIRSFKLIEKEEGYYNSYSCGITFDVMDYNITLYVSGGGLSIERWGKIGKDYPYLETKIHRNYFEYVISDMVINYLEKNDTELLEILKEDINGLL